MFSLELGQLLLNELSARNNSRALLEVLLLGQDVSYRIDPNGICILKIFI